MRQNVDPISDEYSGELQTLQEVCPVSSLNSPAGHGLHGVAPTSVLALVPAGHGVHSEDPAAE